MFPAAVAVFFACRLLAHDLEARVTQTARVVVVRATYGGSQPVAFAKVQVFHPKQVGREYQTGLTDQRGYFSFVPESPGSWRVVIDDEEGHRKEIEVAVAETFASQPAVEASGGPARWERALVGLALIFGATGILYGYKARR